MGDQALAVSLGRSRPALPQARGNRIFMDLAGRWFVQMPLLAGVVMLRGLLIAFAAIARSAAASAWPSARLRSLWRSLPQVGGRLAGGPDHGMRCAPGPTGERIPRLASSAIYATALLAALAVLPQSARRLGREKLRAGLLVAVPASRRRAGAGRAGRNHLFPVPASSGAARNRRSAAGSARPTTHRRPRRARCSSISTWGEMLARLSEIVQPGTAVDRRAGRGEPDLVAALVEAQPLLRAVEPQRGARLRRPRPRSAGPLAAAAPAYSHDHQQRFTIEHVTEFPSGRSFWSVINDGASLPAAYSKLADWRRGKLSFSDRERWFAPAPPIAGLQPPSIEPLEIVRNGDERTIRLRLQAKWRRADPADRAGGRAHPNGRSSRIRAAYRRRRLGAASSPSPAPDEAATGWS